MYGVHKTAYYCNTNRVEELNNRLASRNVPSHELPPQFSSRPKSTKFDNPNYASIAKVGKETTNEFKINNQIDISKVFNPGTSYGPWVGYATHINFENELRNPTKSKHSEDEPYVPSSKSDMYENFAVGRSEKNVHSILFQNDSLAPFDPNTINIGNKMFGNCTRQQIKNM